MQGSILITIMLCSQLYLKGYGEEHAGENIENLCLLEEFAIV